MRLVTSSNFCSPCIEGLWRSLLMRVNLVDRFWGGSCHKPDEYSKQYHLTLDIRLLPLAQFRNDTLQGGGSGRSKESYSLTWSKLEGGKVFPEFQNSTKFLINDTDTQTWFGVDVEFHTDEVRNDPFHLLRSRWFFANLSPCEGQMEPRIIVTQDYAEVVSSMRNPEM
jgi:hypothetical protein